MGLMSFRFSGLLIYSLNPIGLFFAGGGAISCLIASKTDLNCASYFFSSASSFRDNCALEASISLNLTNVRIISIFTFTARLLRSTLESMATPCSVNTRGAFLVPPQLDVPNWNIKLSNSSPVRWNIKSLGKRTRFLLTARFKFPVDTSYSWAKSLSSITL